MKLHLTLFLALILFTFSNCDFNYDDGKYANRIAGDFTITTVTNQDGSINFLSGSTIDVFRRDNKTADVTVDFVGGSDINANNSEISGGFEYVDIDKTYSNAVLIGRSRDPYNSIFLRFDYDDGTFVEIEGERE